MAERRCHAMNIPIERIEGRKLCVVFVKVLDEASGKVRLQCLRGRASVDRGKVSVIADDGCTFTVPGTAVPHIMENDGTPLLKDADYFCLVKVDPSIQLSTKEEMELEDDGEFEEDDCDCDCGCGHDHDHGHGHCGCGHV